MIMQTTLTFLNPKRKRMSITGIALNLKLVSLTPCFFNNNYYGTYNSCISKGVWNFVLKEVRSGKLLLKVTCSVTESHCIVHEESL